VTSSRLLTPRWLAAGGAALLAAVAIAALLLQNGSAACAAPPSSSASKGKATFYDLATNGNCSFPSPPADDLYVALGKSQYSNAAACGTYIDVTGPKGKVRVKVFDSCPECAVGHLDLSRTAFKKIADPAAGVVPITYKAVPSAATPSPISVRVQEGSTKYWFSILIDNHGTQLKSVSVNGKATGRAQYNYWIIENPSIGNGPYKVKVTDVNGRTVTLTGIKLSPGKVQRTSAKLSSGGTVAAAPQATKSKAKAKATAKTKTTAPTVAPAKKKPAAKATSAAPLTESGNVAPVQTVAPAPAATEESVDLAAAGNNSSCR
jgi:expansin